MTEEHAKKYIEAIFPEKNTIWKRRDKQIGMFLSLEVRIYGGDVNYVLTEAYSGAQTAFSVANFHQVYEKA